MQASFMMDHGPAHAGNGTQVSGLPSLMEVMQLVSGRGQDGADNSSSLVELTGSSDPLRITARHALSLQQRTLTVTLDVYNRLPVDVRNAFIRRAVHAKLEARFLSNMQFQLYRLGLIKHYRGGRTHDYEIKEVAASVVRNLRILSHPRAACNSDA